MTVGGRAGDGLGNDVSGGSGGPADAALQAVEAEFPGWHPWRSSGGRVWATRTGPGARYDQDCVPMTVDADTVGALRAELAAISGAP